jgi:Tol biopolymer transport system component
MAKTRCRIEPSVLFILLLVFLTACGTLEVGIERTVAPGDVASATASALPTENVGLATQPVTPMAETTVVPPTPMPTPTPIPAPTELRVAFVKATEHGNNVWLWKEGEVEAVPLTKDGGVGDVKISDDGEIVAFTRGDGLWMVMASGVNEGSPAEGRQLVSAEDFAAMEARDPELEVALNRFEWVPGTRILAFNTRLRMEIGLVLNDDLHLVNADTLERTTLLPPGEGGEFTYSPDGSQMAIVTVGSISLVDADGSNRREVLTYTPVAAHSEAPYYAQPVWAADSGSLRVVIPPVDSFAQPSADASVWHIATDGRPATLLRHIPMAQMSQPAISSDLRYIAHLYMVQSDRAPRSELLITDLELDATITYFPRTDSETEVAPEDEEAIVYNPMAGEIYGWAPGPAHADGERSLAFLAQTEPGLPFQAQIGQLGGDVVPAHSETEVVVDVRWVDADRYLFLAQSPKGWDILLGEIGGPVTGVAGVVGSLSAYDFVAPVGATWSAGTPVPTPTADDAGESPVPFGLIYQNAEGLWHVNGDGESVRLFERPGAVPSSDSTQVLYDEADDVWLVDVTTGERRNLTQTPGRMECCVQWWPGQPDIALFSSRTPQQEGPSFGFLTMVRLDGSDYRVLDNSQASYARPAPSPDGQTVAYDLAGQPWLYRQDTGPEPFDLTLYGLSSDPQLRVVNPAWSPDGQRMAWVIGDCRRGECVYSIGVFDLEMEMARLLHPYTPVGMGGQPPAPAWSPDGRWLAFTAWAVDPNDGGLWVVRADGQGEKHHLDAASRVDHNPIWSPDGNWLAFSSTPQGAGQGLWLAEVETWTLHSADLLPDAYPVDWVSPRS